jgi:hypothetical protein
MTDKVEKLARILAQALNGIDPDTRVAHGEPFRISGVYAYAIPTEQNTVPLWSQFMSAARAVIEAGFDCPDETPAEDALAEETADERTLETPAKPVEAWKERMGFA